MLTEPGAPASYACSVRMRQVRNSFKQCLLFFSLSDASSDYLLSPLALPSQIAAPSLLPRQLAKPVYCLVPPLPFLKSRNATRIELFTLLAYLAVLSDALPGGVEIRSPVVEKREPRV